MWLLYTSPRSPLGWCTPMQRSAVLIPLHLFALNEKQRMEKLDECENECWMTDRVSPSLYRAKQFALLSQNDGIWFSLAPASVVTHREHNQFLSRSRIVSFLFSFLRWPIYFCRLPFFPSLSFLGYVDTQFFCTASFFFLLLSFSSVSMCIAAASWHVKVAHCLNDPGNFNMHEQIEKSVGGNQRK